MFVVTINTWKCEGEYERRISALSRHLSVLNPDIILLQEVFVAPEAEMDTIKLLARRLPDHHCMPIVARPKIRNFEGRELFSLSGLAIISRGERLYSRTIQLPDVPEDRDRVAQLVKMRLHGIDLQIVNLHLCNVRGANETRAIQLQTIIDELEPGPVLMGGDFNSRPDSLPMNLLREHFTDVAVSPFPTGPGGGVIDYLAWRGLNYERYDLEPVFDGKELPVVSDHVGVALHLELNARQSLAS